MNAGRAALLAALCVALAGPALAQDPGPHRDGPSFTDGITLYYQRDYESSARVFLLHAQSHPRDVWGPYMVGLSRWKAGRLEEAEQALRRALEIDPRHLKSHLNLARVLIEREDPGQALEVAAVAVHLAPDRAETHRILGRALHNLAQRQAAEEAYLEALAIDPHDAWAANNLGVLLIEQARFEEAVPYLSAAAEDRPEVAIFQRNNALARSLADAPPTAQAAGRAGMAPAPSTPPEVRPSTTSEVSTTIARPEAYPLHQVDAKTASGAVPDSIPVPGAPAGQSELPASRMPPGTFRVKTTRAPSPR